MRLADRLALFYSFLILLALLLSAVVSAYSLADTLGEESASYNLLFAEDLVEILRAHGTIETEEIEKRKLAFVLIEGQDGSRFEYRSSQTESLDASMVQLTKDGYRIVLATSDQTVKEETLQAVGRQLLAGLPAALLVWALGLYGLRSSVRPLELLTGYTESLALKVGDRGEDRPVQELRQLAGTRGETGGLAKTFLALDSVLEETVARLRESLRIQETMKAEFKVGRELQEGMLPKPLAPRSEFELATRLRPARELGGDLYHHFLVGDKILLAVGDVSGKGVSAAMMMAVAQTLINHCVRESQSLSEAVYVINERLSEDNPLAYFLTLFLALYEPETGRLEYVNAGHPRPFVRRPDGRVTELSGTKGMGLGVAACRSFRAACATLERGDSLVVFTDGLSEAQNRQGDLLGPRLPELLVQAPNGAPATLSYLVEAVERFEEASEPSDDLALLVLRRC